MDNTGYGYDDCIETQITEQNINSAPLTLNVNIEKDILQHNKAHNVFASFKLQAQDSPLGFAVRQRINADFVVVLDTSESMKNADKLASVLATIEYLIDVLTEKDRFALVHFNEKATVLFSLDYVTNENKSLLLCILQNIQAIGNTNISDGLFTALSILQARQDDNLPISRILLLTDGLSNRGLSHSDMIQKLREEQLHENLTIHCFGYGKDHSSSCLQAIAFRSPGGLYYYVENSDQIAETFGDCLADTFSTVAYSIHVYIEAFDGCRFIKIRTKYPFKTIKQMKKYYGALGSMYYQESRSVLMRLSLRALQTGPHKIFQVTVSYRSAIDNIKYSHKKLIVIQRKQELQNIPISSEIDRQINRVTAAEAIDKAISAASVKNFGTAEQILHFAIQKISSSNTASDPYCKDLIADLKDCTKCVNNQETFSSDGKHEAHQYSTMHNQERSVGVINHRGNRSKEYGYVTAQQIQESKKASNAIQSYISAYKSNEIDDIFE